MHTVSGNTICINGDLSMMESGDVKKAALQVIKEYKEIVFDLENAGLVNSSGLTTFALAARNCPGHVSLRNTPLRIKKLLAITGLNEYLDFQ